MSKSSLKPTFSKGTWICCEETKDRMWYLYEYLRGRLGCENYISRRQEELERAFARYNGIDEADFLAVFDQVYVEIGEGKYLKPRELILENISFGEEEDWGCDSRRNIYGYRVGGCFLDEPGQEDWLVDNLIAPGQFTAVAAAGGVGKTWLGLDLGLKLSADKGAFLSFSILEKCLVFFVTLEDSEDSIHRRLEALDPEVCLRESGSDNFFILTAAEAFEGHFQLINSDDSPNDISDKYKWLIREIAYQQAKFPDFPVVVIFDTYSATHHSDENTVNGAVSWFRAASLLIKNFNAAVVVMHHIRKIGYNERTRTPEDLLMCVRGSNAFVNSCRRVIGIWPLTVSEAKKICDKEASLYNFSILKDNNYVDWSDIDVGCFNRPTITLKRSDKGFLTFDRDINENRKSLVEAKKPLSDVEESELQGQLIGIVEHCASDGYPLSKSTFDKQRGYKKLLSKKFVACPPKIIRSVMQKLVSEGRVILAEITINNKTCEVYDVPGGDYSQGLKRQRTSTEVPVSPFFAGSS